MRIHPHFFDITHLIRSRHLIWESVKIAVTPQCFKTCIKIDTFPVYLYFASIALMNYLPFVVFAYLMSLSRERTFVSRHWRTRTRWRFDTSSKVMKTFASLGPQFGYVLIEFIFYVYDTVNAVVTLDAISGISGSGNPTIVRVSLADSTRSSDSPAQLWHAHTQRWQKLLVYIILDV